VLEAVELSKSYGEIQALRGASLTVGEGQIVSLLGRNGAGKTTMLSIIAGLLRPDGGTVTIGGVDALADPEAAAKLLGIAPQDTGIYGVLTVRQNLEFFGELSGLDRGVRSRRATEIADRLGLGPLLDRKGSNLSGGETRRLHTACALVHTPRLLMLDEPTVGADVTTRLQIIDAVRDLAADGAAVVYTTHYLPEVTALEADLVIIDDGQVLATGSQSELIERHQIQALQFEVDGDLPATFTAEAESLGNNRWQIAGDLDMPTLLDRFGDQVHRLRAVESLKPDLETVFLAVTGNRIDAEYDADEGGVAGAAADGAGGAGAEVPA